MGDYDEIPAFVPDEPLTHAVIETPKGIRHKYAYEPKYGIMLLKQTLAEGLAWPYDYGFIPQTVGDDGDPLDVLVLNDVGVVSGCLQRVRILGAVLLKKNGEENDRYIAAPAPVNGVAQAMDAFDDLHELPEDLLHGIERFLTEYSEEAGNEITIEGRISRDEALRRVKAGHTRFLAKT